MVQANDLRIGNYLLRPDKTIGKVEEIHKDIVYYENSGSDRIKIVRGIQLTKDILVKCGFFKDEMASEWEEKLVLKTEKFGISINVETLDFYNGIFTQKVKYLHQLQNLYFALTNTEIEVNL